MKKKVWVITEPVDGRWDEVFALETIIKAYQKWGVKVTPTSETRNVGLGKEWLYIVSGKPEMINKFEASINEVFPLKGG